MLRFDPRLLATLVLALATATATPAQDAKSDAAQNPPEATKNPIPAPLSDAIPVLQAQSSWEQDTRHEGPRPDKTKRGVYPVGNGSVFTYMGLGERANTMMALTGPTYAAAEQRLPRGHFGELTLDLEGVDLPVQKVRRVSAANFVVTSDATESGLALRTLTFAAPDSKTITRVIVVHNGTGTPAKNLALAVRLSGGEQSATDALIRKTYEQGAHHHVAVFTLEKGEVKGGRLLSRIGNLAPDESFVDVLTITTARRDGQTEITGHATLAEAVQAARATVDWWKQKLEDAPALRTDNDKIMDLFQDWKILMWTMRDAHSGMVSPMVTRRGAFIRESSGPLLTFLRYNMWSEAKAILDYYYKAIRQTGEIREYYPLDLDFSGLGDDRGEGATDWRQVRFPDSDLLSWIVLQHFWYYRSTRDAKLIEDRKDFLVACLSRQRREKGSLMRFGGNENWMNPTLHTLDLAKMSRNPRLIAEDPEHDRHGYSLARSVLFLVALHGMGDMVNGIDQMNNPAKWAVDPSEIKDKPSQVWLERSLPVMRDLERHYWVQNPDFAVRDDIDPGLKQYGDDWTGFFAPALSPVTGEPHREPVANANLLPLWVGFTFPTGERSQHNLRNTLGRLWHRQDKDGKRTSALVGSTAKVGHFTGDVPGMLLTALIERDGRDRYQAHQEMLRIAAPAGEWGQFYDPEGRPVATDDPEWPHRMSPNECGINVDAAIYALNGVRHVNIANFDNTSIKLKLRLPEGTKFLEMDNLRKDGRAFNVHVDDFWAPLSEEERKQNDAQQDPRFKRDPKIDHRRFRFRFELVSENPPLGRYQVDADVSGTMFVRYAYRGLVGGRSGIIEESEFWKKDGGQFYIDGSPTVTPGSNPIKAVPGAQLLVMTNRAQAAETFGKQVSYIDTGLPFTGLHLLSALLKDGKPTHPKLFLDVEYDAADRRTWKREAFWKHPEWQRALADFAAAGGEILRPAFVETFQVRSGDGPWQEVAAPEGRLRLPGGSAHHVRATFSAARSRDDLVLRIGSGCGYRARCKGEVVASATGPRRALRDQDANLIEFEQGTNVIEFELDGDGEQLLFLQITRPDGLPPAGVSGS